MPCAVWLRAGQLATAAQGVGRCQSAALRWACRAAWQHLCRPHWHAHASPSTRRAQLGAAEGQMRPHVQAQCWSTPCAARARC